MDEAQPPKVRKALDEEALKKLALAREKANLKRKELAAQRAKDRETLVQQKLEEKKVKNERAAEKEAERRSLESVEDTTPVEAELPQPPPPKPKPKKQTVVIETSDSEEEDISNAKVYFVKRELTVEAAPPTVANPSFPVTTEAQNNDHKDSKFRPTGGVKPLKTISKLTPEQLEQGRMVTAAYELEAKIGDLIQETGVDEISATRDVMNTHGNNELKKLGLDDWALIEDLSTRQHVVLQKGDKLTIAMRGRAGDNPVDNTHVLDTLKGKPRDYSELDRLYEQVQRIRPDATVDVVSYSNSGAKGLHLSQKYNLPHYSIDPVLGPTEVGMLANKKPGTAPLEIVRTTKPALASGMGVTAQQILSGQANNTQVINVEPVKLASSNPLEHILDAHDLHHYTNLDETNALIPESERAPAGLIGKNLAGSVAAGVVPAVLAGVAVEGIAPNQNREAKIGEEAVTAAAIGQVFSPLVGAGAAPMAATALPLYASFEAADKVAMLTDKVLPDDMGGVPKKSIEGAVAGTAGGTTFGAASMAQTAVVSTARTVLAPTTVGATEGVELASAAAVDTALAPTATAVAATEGIELAEIGAGVVAEEVGIEAAIASGAAAGGLATSEFGLLAAGGAILGGLVGLGVGLAGGGQKEEPVTDYFEGGNRGYHLTQYEGLYFNSENETYQFEDRAVQADNARDAMVLLHGSAPTSVPNVEYVGNDTYQRGKETVQADSAIDAEARLNNWG